MKGKNMKGKEITNYLKSRIRRYRSLEYATYFLYTRFTFSYRASQTKLLHFFIQKIRSLVIKKEISKISILSEATILELKDGSKFYWDTTDRTSLLGLGLAGVWEKDDTEYLKKIIKPGNTVVDIGANYGFHAVLFSRLVGDSGIVYSFEPLKKMFKQLTENVRLNNGQENTVLVNSALGDKKGRLTIYTPAGIGNGAASFAKRGTVAAQEVCEVITLDSFATSKKIKKIDFIKCDIEGAELLAFKGAQNVLKKFHPAMMIEVTRGSSEAFGYTPEILFQFLNTFGYEFFYASKNKLMKIEPRAVPYFHGNCFAIVKK